MPLSPRNHGELGLKENFEMTTNKLLNTTAVAVLLSLGVSAAPMVVGAHAANAATAASDAIDANELIGQSIVNANGDTVGEIENVVIDKDGAVKYVIAGVGGFLGVGEKHVAIQWDALTITENGEHVVANVTKEQLEALPEHKVPETVKPDTVYSYDDDIKSNPYLSDGGIAAAPSTDTSSQSADTTGTTESAVEPAAGMPMLQASDVIGANVKNPDGTSIGEVSEMIVKSDGSIEGVVVDVGGFLGVGAHPVLLGWPDLHFSGKVDDPTVTTSLSKEQLTALPAYKTL
jgi:sporulation protein YlmC with PRC-barrel domain